MISCTRAVRSVIKQEMLKVKSLSSLLYVNIRKVCRFIVLLHCFAKSNGDIHKFNYVVVDLCLF